ncbi:hypothetical protein BHYA_0244g00010 [Botrytis hyacinthi]|uniref:Uncharacterized protein n=1 Tax=Botrytis hyacinthi TaxID=278943 RepID=A0A4Z1G902_9HELO|nr:hypothetical protein BHYA_0244g00010 [Botrytis hyacinthi]
MSMNKNAIFRSSSFAIELNNIAVFSNSFQSFFFHDILLKSSVKMFPFPSEEGASKMPSLCSDGAEPKSGPVCADPEVEQVNLNLDYPGRQLGRKVAKLIKDNKLDVEDIQNGVHEIQEREKVAQEVLLQAVDDLRTYKTQRIMIEILEKNFVVREWFWKHLGLEMIHGNQLELTKVIDIIKKLPLSSVRRITRVLIIDNGFIEECLKKKLLVEQKDGTFATRKLEPDAI